MDRLILHDDAADELGATRRGKKHFAVGPTALGRRVDVQRVKAPRQGGGGLISRQEAFPVSDEGLCGALEVHGCHLHHLL
jgi:hypothetical protein